VKDRISPLELHESKIRLESLEQVSKRAATAGDRALVTGDGLVGFIAALWVNAILATRVLDLLEDSLRVTRRRFGGGHSRNQRAVEGSGWVGDGYVDDDTREARLTEEFPDGARADVRCVDDVPVVAVETEEIVDAVFPRILARIHRWPGARRPGWEL